jgi:proline iminopeptidase
MSPRPSAVRPPAPRAGLSVLRFAALVVSLVSAGCGDLAIGTLLPPTAEEDPRLPQIQLEVLGRSRAIHLETFGSPESPVLLAFHGGEGSDYRAMLPLAALSDRYFVVLWDARGSGLSERIERSEISEASYAAEVHAIKQRFSPERPVALVGYSYGGFHSALYLTHHPTDVSELVLIEPNAFDSETAAGEPEADVPVGEGWVHSYLWQNEFVTPDDHERMDFKLTSVTQDAVAFIACEPEHAPRYPLWRMGAFAYLAVRDEFRTYDFRPAMAAFPSPVLIVASSCGGLNAAHQRKDVAPVFADARVVELPPGADHLNLFDHSRTALLASLRGHLSAYQGAGE